MSYPVHASRGYLHAAVNMLMSDEEGEDVQDRGRQSQINLVRRNSFQKDPGSAQ